MSDQATPAKPLPTPDTHPLIFRLAREIGTPISFYDLETTGLGHGKPTFGITEFAFLAVLPNGQAHAHAKLINPENRIEFDAERVTGISQDMVKDAPTIAQHADKILRMMERSLMVGFNCDSYDTPALLGQLDRYNVARPAAWKSVDLYSVWKTVQNRKDGKQTVVAEHYGVPFQNAHRALADCSALADILEGMLWHHGMQPFHKALRHNWDGVSRDAEGNAVPKAERSARSAPKSSAELSESQNRLKDTIDASLVATPSMQQFKTDLAAAGFDVEVNRWGAVAYIHGKTTDHPERTGGSVLGKGYSWTDVKTRLSGGAPDAPSSQGTTGPRQGTPERGAEEAAAKATLLELAKEGGRIDLARACEQSGASAKAVSFAISSLLAEGLVSPDQARDPAAQAWLDTHWDTLPTQGKLTPLLEKCKSSGAPAEVDFTQLRVALASRKASMPARAASARPAPSHNGPRDDPRRSAPSVPFRTPAAAPLAVADYDGPPPFDDDMPPPFDMDDTGTLSRMAP
jgi:DNA polymerase III epsilon subunit-like protein